jgi:hypothetical protein
MIPDLSIAGYSVPVLLTVVMGLIFKFVPVITDRYKAVLTVVAAIILAVGARVSEVNDVITLAMWVETVIGGVLIGAAAIGLYEIQRTVSKPRV